MSTVFPYLVIGRGIAGLTVAFELLKQRRSVAVIGPSSFEQCATGAAVGLSSLKGQYHASKPLFAAKVDGHRHLWPWLAEIEAVSGQLIPRFRSCSYEPFWSLTEYERIRERVFHRDFTGHTGAMLTSPDESIQNLFSLKIAGHAVYDGDLWFEPRTCMEALEKAITNLGGSIFDDSITRLVSDETRIRVEGINCSYKSEHLILAGGVYSDVILKNSGISGPKQKAVFGETIVTDRFSHGSPQIVHMGQKHLIGHDDTWRYGSSSYNIESFDGLSHQCLEPALYLDSRLAPDLFPNKFSTRYTGIRGRYQDIAPCIGELNLPDSQRKIMLFCGFYKSGLQLAPLFAKKLASFYCLPQAFLFEPQFSVSRFS